eukprot:COSAG02_NODE_514_length_20825_cov_5.990495_14_plen_214_part_00
MSAGARGAGCTADGRSKLAPPVAPRTGAPRDRDSPDLRSDAWFAGLRGGRLPGMEDIEDLAGRQAPARAAARQSSSHDLRDYVLQLDARLRQRSAAAPDGNLSHDDFHAVTADLNKEKKHAVYGKPQVIHEYRACVREGLLAYNQDVEALLIKKLGKSGYGGVNLSLFVPVSDLRRPPARCCRTPSVHFFTDPRVMGTAGSLGSGVERHRHAS